MTLRSLPEVTIGIVDNGYIVKIRGDSGHMRVHVFADRKNALACVTEVVDRIHKDRAELNDPSLTDDFA